MANREPIRRGKRYICCELRLFIFLLIIELCNKQFFGCSKCNGTIFMSL